MSAYFVTKTGKIGVLFSSVEKVKTYLKTVPETCVIEEWSDGIKQRSYTPDEFRVAAILSLQYLP